MTTTAHEDQFTDAPEPVRQQYSTADILRRNVADLEIALKQQTERAEAAEAELLAVREDNHSMMMEIDGLRTERDRLAAELESLRWQKPVATLILSYDGADFEMYYDNNKLRFEGMSMKLYAAAGAAPAVPAGYVAHLAQLADDPCQCHCCRTKQRKARALLQSAEALHD